jgi:glutamyl-tRNA reductase
VKIVLVGLNHRTAPLEVRERFSLPASRSVPLNQKLLDGESLIEAAILSTCNRIEIVGVSHDLREGAERLFRFLSDEVGPGGLDPQHVYQLGERDAVVHLLRVAASLDSMVLGEAQILGQVKDAYRAAVEAGSCGTVLNRLFERAFRAAKRVRTETGLGASSVSVAQVGVQLGLELFESFESKRVLLLGAGEMAESAMEGLRQAGVQSVIANRTLEPARRLAERFGGRAISFDDLEAELPATDVLLTSVEVSEPVVRSSMLQHALTQRQGSPLLVIDLGLPRNVDPEAADLENLYLYDLDDLEQIAERGRESRKQAVGVSSRIVHEESDRFEEWRATLEVVPTIQELVSEAEALARVEVERALSRLRAPDAAPEETVRRLADGIVQKLLHRPLARLRDAAADGTGVYYAEAVRRLFALEEEE